MSINVFIKKKFPFWHIEENEKSLKGIASVA